MSKNAVVAIAALLLLAAPRAHAAMDQSSSDSNYLESQATERDSRAMNDDEDENDMEETSSATTQSATDEEADVPAKQDAIEMRNEETEVRPARQVRPVAPPAPMAREDRPAAPATVVEAKPEIGGDLRGPSPKVLDPNRRGFFQLGVGPAYGAAFVSDSLMYNVVGSYNFNTSERFTLKGLADLYMGTGSVSSRLYNFGVGAEYYVSELDTNIGVPYVAGDAGVGFGRNAQDQTGTALTLGAGAGFRFAVNELNCDVNLHYAQMTANLGPSAPAIFALRGSVAF